MEVEVNWRWSWEAIWKTARRPSVVISTIKRRLDKYEYTAEWDKCFNDKRQGRSQGTCYLFWGLKEEEAGQPPMKAWEGDGANNPGSHFQTWRIKRWLGVMTKTNICYDAVTILRKQCMFCVFSEAFKTDNTLINKLMKHELNEQTVAWIGNWLNRWAQRIEISGTVCTSVTKWCIPGFDFGAKNILLMPLMMIQSTPPPDFQMIKNWEEWLI